MSKPIKRSQVDRPLTCAEYDSNLDATLDRANHTGTQSATTIYDLYETVDDYDFIKALKKCCQDLKDQLDQLKRDLFGEGELSRLLDRLRQELLQMIEDLTRELEDLKARVVRLENNYTALLSSIQAINLAITNLRNALDAKANIDSPTFIGIPRAPQPGADSNDNQIATTQFVRQFAVPTGTVIPFAGSTNPAGYLTCNGQAVSRTTYAALFAVIGTQYGAGNGSSTFNLPNLCGRTVVGSGVSNASGQLFPLAGFNGAETVALNTLQLPTHSHVVLDYGHSHDTQDPGHAHVMNAGPSNVEIEAGGEFTPYGYGTPYFGVNASFTNINVALATTDIAIQETGYGTPFSIMQPFTVLNYIIKA